MAETTLKTIVSTPPGQMPEQVVLANIDLPEDVVPPRRGLVTYYGVTEAAKTLSERARVLRATGQDVSVVEISVDVGDAHPGMYDLPHDPKTRIVRLNRLKAEARAALLEYATAQTGTAQEAEEAFSWRPPYFVVRRLDLLEQATNEAILKPVDVVTLHLPASREPTNAAFLSSSSSVTKIAVFGPHRNIKINLPI